MKKKIIGILAAAGLVLGLGLVICSRMLPGEYVPAADEIALKIHFDTAEDVGLLVYDYQADGHEYSGGISNVDGSLIKRDSENIVVWDRAELAPRAEPFELSIRFRVITEYVAPNYENVYPEEITEYLDPISWQAHLGKTYSLTLTGDRTNGYQAVLNQ